MAALHKGVIPESWIQNTPSLNCLLWNFEFWGSDSFFSHIKNSLLILV